jgi:hypothetical protein
MAKGVIHKELADKLRTLIERGKYSPLEPVMSLREIGRK